MTGNVKDVAEEHLTLHSRISELSQLHAWVDRLALRHKIPDNTQFAINLCLEEVLSNVIRHGYFGSPDHSIDVRFTKPREGYFIFDVKDEAPPFDPLRAPELPAMSSLDHLRVGGQGLRRLRQFSDSLEYQAMPTGNRLSMGFLAMDSTSAQ